MTTQILALIVAMTIVYFLSRLRYFILVRSKNKQKFYRTYIVGFDETDWDSDLDDNSRNESDSKGATILHTAEGNSLVEWPAELELQATPSTHLQTILADGCDEVVRTVSNNAERP